MVTEAGSIRFACLDFRRGLQTPRARVCAFGLGYKESRGLRTAVYVSMAMTVLGVVMEKVLGTNSFPLLKATPSLTGRPSGFSTEASTLSVQIVYAGTLTVHLCHGRLPKLLPDYS